MTRSSAKTLVNLLASDFVALKTRNIKTHCLHHFLIFENLHCYLFLCFFHIINNNSILVVIRLPTCRTHKSTNTTGRMEKDKSFFRIREPKNLTEQKRAQQWLGFPIWVWNKTENHLSLVKILFWVKTIFTGTAWEVSIFAVFLVHIFPHSDLISRIQSECQKYGLEKLRIRTHFT